MGFFRGNSPLSLHFQWETQKTVGHVYCNSQYAHNLASNLPSQLDFQQCFWGRLRVVTDGELTEEPAIIKVRECFPTHVFYRKCRESRELPLQNDDFILSNGRWFCNLGEWWPLKLVVFTQNRPTVALKLLLFCSYLAFLHYREALAKHRLKFDEN